MADIDSDFVHLARLAIQGRQEDVTALARRALRPLIKRRPDLAEQANSVLQMISVDFIGNVLRAKHNEPIPVDADSRLELLRRELILSFETEPVWPDTVKVDIEATLAERQRVDELLDAGLTPTRSLLFVGEPGVGKTFAARWIAHKLQRPLLTLDLAAVMSSFLGRTGNNIRVVLDYARRSPSVLLLDEFDAIAKRRDDTAEVGELKRLVTVLLQSIDDWPTSGVLIAATNHPELLDHAVWRRFDKVVSFPKPTAEQIALAIRKLIPTALEPDLDRLMDVLSLALEGQSFAEVAKLVNSARRASILESEKIQNVLIETAFAYAHSRPKKDRYSIVQRLSELGYSQREVSRVTGVSRPTIRKLGNNGLSKEE